MTTQVAPSFVLSRDSLQAHEPSLGFSRFRRRGYQRSRQILSNVDLGLLWKRRWFIVTMVVGFILMSLPSPSGLSAEGQVVLVMSLMATMLFTRNLFPFLRSP
jgi:solute carrier family 13 (sodium-dependent dicarboxylate transporter), member 2/3/5